MTAPAFRYARYRRRRLERRAARVSLGILNACIAAFVFYVWILAILLLFT